MLLLLLATVAMAGMRWDKEWFVTNYLSIVTKHWRWIGIGIGIEIGVRIGCLGVYDQLYGYS